MSKNDFAPGGGNLKKAAAAAESPTTWTPAMQAEHKLMMSGVPEGKAPKAAGPVDDAGWKERQAYRKAFEEHVSHFLSGNMVHPDSGETVQHREDALAHAHVAGRKAVQAMKKSGIKFSVYTDGH